jgi:uncharacterized membrane protein
MIRLIFKMFRKDSRLHKKDWLWLAAIVAVAAFLRLINISAEPFWADEILSLDITTSFASVAEMVRYVGQVEFHPPLYYLLLGPWVSIFGETEAAVRSLSLIAGLGIVVMGYVLARDMFRDKHVGLLTAAIIAILPMQIEYAQEARPYALFCLAGCLAVWSVWRLLESGRREWVILYVLATTIGCYLHYSYSFLAVALAVWWLFESCVRGKERRPRILEWSAAQAVVFVAFWPWLDNFLYKVFLGSFDIFGLRRNTFPIREPNFFGDLFESVIWLTKDKYVPPVQNFAIGLAVGIAVWVLFITARKRGVFEAKPVRALLMLTLIPAVLFLFAPQSLPYTTLVQRHMIWLTVPIAIMIAVLSARAGKKKGGLLMVVFMISLLPYVVGVIGNDAYFDHDFRLKEGGTYINDNYREGDLVIVAFNILRSDLSHYLDEDIPVETLVPVEYRGNDVWRGRHVLGLVENETQVRIPPTDKEDVYAKLDWIMEKHDPERVWIYGLTQKDHKAHDWFEDNEWRRGFWSVSDLLRLDMYSNR